MSCSHPHIQNVKKSHGDNAPGFDFSGQQRAALFEFIYNNNDLPLRELFAEETEGSDILQDLYYATADYLKKGVYSAFGKGINLADFETSEDFELLQELRENIYMFSAAKTYQQVRALSNLVVDGDRIRSKKEFIDLGSQQFKEWNTVWGEAEYTTCVGQASTAVKWMQIQRDKDVLSVLVFSTNGKPCDECSKYEGFSAPVDDPIWDWLMPLLHFYCMCIVLQQAADYPISDEDTYNSISELKDTVDSVFQMNPGKDKVIFNEEHPYFDVARKDKAWAKDNFGFDIPEKD